MGIFPSLLVGISVWAAGEDALGDREGDEAFSYIAYTTDPWPRGALHLKLIGDGEPGSRTIHREPARTRVGGILWNEEWYVGAVDARAGRIAFTRFVMVNERWNEPSPVTGEPEEHSRTRESYVKLVVTDMRGANAREFCRDPGHEVYSPRISPDGRYVAFSYGTVARGGGECVRSRIRVLDSVAGDIRDVTADLPDTWAWSPAWSPDGTWLAYHVRGKRPGHGYLVAQPHEAGEPRKLAVLPGPGNRISWAQDGRGIASEFERRLRRRGNAWAHEVRIATLDVETREVRNAVDAVVDMYAECLVGHAASGGLIYRAVDPAIADRRYYTCDWNVVLRLPPSTRYVLDQVHAQASRRLAIGVPDGWSVYPILPRGRLIDETALRSYPPFAFGGGGPDEPTDADAIRIVTVAREAADGGRVRVEARIEDGDAIDSAWWEDVEGNQYPGMSAEIPRGLLEAGVSFFVVGEQGLSYRQHVAPRLGAPPETALVNPAERRTIDAEVHREGNRIRIRLAGQVGLELVRVPRGTITTTGLARRERFGAVAVVRFVDDPGYADHMDRPRTRTVGPFYLGTFEVTQEQFEAVMGRNPSTFRGPRLPVETVRGTEAKEFCRRLSEATGLDVRLPNATEWEHACRAGTAARYYWGEELSPERCNYAARWAGAPVETESAWKRHKDRISAGHTVVVGSFDPNPWGLHDMFGNVAEMCRGRAMEARIAADGTTTYRTCRFSGNEDVPDEDTCFPNMGGGWVHYGKLLTEGRTLSHIDFGTDWTGFRILVEPGGEPPPPSDEGQF